MFLANYIILIGFILGLTDISAQLSLALAMDRCDITRSTIFIDSRRKELHVSVFGLEVSCVLALFPSENPHPPPTRDENNEVFPK